MNLAGDATFGDTGGPVELQLIDGTAVLGEIGDAVLEILGGGHIETARVVGDLAVNVRGTGNVRVGEGEIGELAVEIAGTGGVEVGGQAERARLTIAGMGNIHVDRVVERPQVTVMGLGDINIGNW
jgi:hypothetical protein